jgi:hypothetical protein
VSVNGRACVKRRPVRLSRGRGQRTVQAALNLRDVLRLSVYHPRVVADPQRAAERERARDVLAELRET